MNIPQKSPRNLWPVAIIAYFVLFIGFTIGIVGYISHQKMDLVRGDYYNDEVRYQQQLDRIGRTEGLKEKVAIGYDQAKASITINLPAPAPSHPMEGHIQLYRPSDETMDRTVQLALTSAGRQEVDVKALHPGLWKVRVYWTVDGHEYYFGQSVVVGARKS